MTIGTDLLRMLEPAVRPDGVNPPRRTQPSQPIEQQGFQQLLDEAKLMMQQPQQQVEQQSQIQAQDNNITKQAAAEQFNPIDHLASVGRIENDSLRMLIGKTGT